MRDLPLVSVIVTTRDSSSTLADCLNSVKSQDYFQQRIETIVVDNNSTDDTTEIAKQFTENVFSAGPERSAQRNLGIEKARGQYLIYLDSDMALSESVISECVDKCEAQGLTALYIPERIMGESYWAAVRDFERGFYTATVIDCVRFIKKALLDELGGFDRNLTGPEDWDLDRRVRQKGRVSVTSAWLNHNEGVFNLRQYLRKKAYYAGSFAAYTAKWGRRDPVIKRQLGFYYRYLGVFIERGKWQKLFRHPGLALGMYFLRLAVGLAYLTRKR